MLNFSKQALAMAGCILALAGALASTAKADTFDTILKTKKITVGYIPYDDLTRRDLSTGKVVGLLPEVVEKIAAGAGIPAENITYVATDWANFGVGLQSGKFDFSIAATFATIPRATVAAFTHPLFYLGNSAIVRKGDDRFADVKTIMDLDREGITIAVVSGEQSHDFASKNFKKAKLKVLKSADLSTAMLEVLAQRADVAMSDHYVVKSFVATHPEAVDLFARNPWGIQPIAWATRTDDLRLRDFLNTAIDYLHSTSELEKMMRAPTYKNVPFLLPELKFVPIQ